MSQETATILGAFLGTLIAALVGTALIFWRVRPLVEKFLNKVEAKLDAQVATTTTVAKESATNIAESAVSNLIQKQLDYEREANQLLRQSIADQEARHLAEIRAMEERHSTIIQPLVDKVSTLQRDLDRQKTEQAQREDANAKEIAHLREQVKQLQRTVDGVTQERDLRTNERDAALRKATQQDEQILTLQRRLDEQQTVLNHVNSENSFMKSFFDKIQFIQVAAHRAAELPSYAPSGVVVASEEPHAVTPAPDEE